MKNMSQKHGVSLVPRLGAQGLPQSHTCFFDLDLPEYEDEKTMREKILIAITMCGEIDMDGGPNRWEKKLGWSKS